ncbi:MAG: hypothetical protein R3A80_05210 [Bdellovibrionota bacterium]
MPYSKRTKKSQLSKKKVAQITPRDYTTMGVHPSYVHFNPAGEKQMILPISHSLEKWILMILLAFAMAAFLGFKMLENSELAFSLTDGSTENFAAHSVSNEKEFKNEFNKSRDEARAIMQKHKQAKSIKTSPKYGKGQKKYYAKKKSKLSRSKKVAKRKSHKRKGQVAKRRTRSKKSVASK